MNTRIAEPRVGGRSRYPGRVAEGPSTQLGVDLGGSLAEAERLRRDGALPQARQVLGRAVDLGVAVPGCDPLELCTARRVLAEIMCEMGDQPAAFNVLTTLVHEAEHLFGPRHPACVRSLAVLAAVVHEMGDYASAEQMYHEVGERIGDRESRAGSLVRVRLALLERDRGNLDAARERLNEAYQKHRDAFGGEDPDTVSIAAQLAELHRDAGDRDSARRVLTVAYVAACSSLGEEHELTRSLECDLQAIEPPMPSAPVDLPEDTMSTRTLKRRHSKKGVKEKEGPTGRLVAPSSALPGATPPSGTSTVPAMPGRGQGRMAPAYGGPAPVSPAPGFGPGSVPPAPVSSGPAPGSGARRTPRRPAEMPTEPAVPIPPLSPARLSELAAAETMVQRPVAAQRPRRPMAQGVPTQRPMAQPMAQRRIAPPVSQRPVARPERKSRGRAFRVVAILMFVVAILAGAGLAYIGVTLL